MGPVRWPSEFILSVHHDNAPHDLGWLDLAEGRLTPRSPQTQWRPVNFLPLADHPAPIALGPRCAHSSRGKKAARRPSFAALRA